MERSGVQSCSNVHFVLQFSACKPPFRIISATLSPVNCTPYSTQLPVQGEITCFKACRCGALNSAFYLISSILEVSDLFILHRFLHQINTVPSLTICKLIFTLHIKVQCVPHRGHFVLPCCTICNTYIDYT
jgi:hypothetical protein